MNESLIASNIGNATKRPTIMKSPRTRNPVIGSLVNISMNAITRKSTVAPIRSVLIRFS